MSKNYIKIAIFFDYNEIWVIKIIFKKFVKYKVCQSQIYLTFALFIPLNVLYFFSLL